MLVWLGTAFLAIPILILGLHGLHAIDQFIAGKLNVPLPSWFMNIIGFGLFAFANLGLSYGAAHWLNKRFGPTRAEEVGEPWLRNSKH